MKQGCGDDGCSRRKLIVTLIFDNIEEPITLENVEHLVASLEEPEEHILYYEIMDQ